MKPFKVFLVLGWTGFCAVLAAGPVEYVIKGAPSLAGDIASHGAIAVVIALWGAVLWGATDA